MSGETPKSSRNLFNKDKNSSEVALFFNKPFDLMYFSQKILRTISSVVIETRAWFLERTHIDLSPAFSPIITSLPSTTMLILLYGNKEVGFLSW